MSSFAPQQSDDAAVATIRTLAADVVGKANSGHPGTPLRAPRRPPRTDNPIQARPWAWPLRPMCCSRGTPPSGLEASSTLTYLSSFFNTNPKSSKWYNRDRFVLSNG